MSNPLRYVRTVMIVLSLIWVSSCAERTVTLTLLTDRPETAAAAAVFDSLSKDLVIDVHHVAAIDQVAITALQPDLLIGTHLSTPDVLAELRPLKMGYPVYEAFEGYGFHDGRPRLVPLSFEFPIIVGRTSTIAALPDPVIVKPEELRTATLSSAVRNTGGRLTRLGFSPSWNPDFLSHMMMAVNPDVFAGGIPDESDPSMETVMAEIRDWIAEAAGSPDEDAGFNQRYRYLPDDYLILDDRITFAMMDFRSWNALPSIITSELDFRYLGGRRTIPVVSVVSAAIPSKNRRIEPALRFIEWLMDSDVQTGLMDRWERDSISVFGYFGGLSTIPRTNETELIRRYPVMEGKLPESHYFGVPSMLPDRWRRVRSEVIGPWFIATVSGAGNGESLIRAYRRWDLSSLEQTD